MVGFVFIGPVLMAGQIIVNWVAVTQISSDFVEQAPLVQEEPYPRFLDDLKAEQGLDREGHRLHGLPRDRGRAGRRQLSNQRVPARPGAGVDRSARCRRRRPRGGLRREQGRRPRRADQRRLDGGAGWRQPPVSRPARDWSSRWSTCRFRRSGPACWRGSSAPSGWRWAFPSSSCLRARCCWPFGSGGWACSSSARCRAGALPPGRPARRSPGSSRGRSRARAAEAVRRSRARRPRSRPPASPHPGGQPGSRKRKRKRRR